MGAKTGISWATSTFNPWWGCTKVSPGCDHCYAEGTARRWGTQWGANAVRRTFGDKHWNEPLAWNAKAARSGQPWRVFVASMADVFDKDAPEGARERLWALIRATPALTWMVLTKRIGNATRMLPADWGDGYPNVWLGATIVNQEEADRDIAKLAATPARVRFLSCEPLLGPIDLRRNLPAERMLRWYRPMVGMVDWIIVGGESGVSARPMNPAWATSLRDQCAAARVPFFFKQWGEWLPFEQREAGQFSDSCSYPSRDGAWRVGKLLAGDRLDGVEHKAFPEARP